MSWLDEAWQAAEVGTAANGRGHRGAGDNEAETKTGRDVAPSPAQPGMVPGTFDRGQGVKRPGTPQSQGTCGSQRPVPGVPAVPGRSGRVVRLHEHGAPLHLPQPRTDPLDLRAAEIGIAYGLPNPVARAFVLVRDGEPAPATAHLWPTLTAHMLKVLSDHFGRERNDR